MITHIIIKMHCKRRVHLQDLHCIFTACSRCSRRPHSELSNTMCKRQAAAFVLSMFKINAAAWRSRRLYSVFTAFPQRSTALLATAQRAPRRSATFFSRCWNAVRTPLWFDMAFSSNVYYEASHALNCQLSRIAPRK